MSKFVYANYDSKESMNEMIKHTPTVFAMNETTKTKIDFDVYLNEDNYKNDPVLACLREGTIVVNNKFGEDIIVGVCW